jgi:putative phosphoribosyl transferase
MKFRDRIQAGKLLAQKLSAYHDLQDVLVLALPRGGIPVAYEIAKTLQAPFDIYLVRKLGVPGNEELAMGAITLDSQVFNYEILEMLSIEKSAIDRVIAEQQQELQRRNAKYRLNRPMPEIANKTIILVDDGLATGATMRAAVQSLYEKRPASIVVAVPVMPLESKQIFSNLVDDLMCLEFPEFLYSISYWYESFPQLTDQEVFRYLQAAKSSHLLAVE